jgi:hypothetical protein
MTQEEVDLIFSITSTMYNHSWFKDSERTEAEIQKWVAEKLESLDIYTIPCGMSWGVLTDKQIRDDR